MIISLYMGAQYCDVITNASCVVTTFPCPSPKQNEYKIWGGANINELFNNDKLVT